MKFIFILFAIVGFATDDIRGFWQTEDEEGNPQCVFAIYEYDEAIYGRIIGIYNEEGVMDDTIYHPAKRAPGCLDNPYYCGLDIIWQLYDFGERFKGRILDPEKGNIYKAELWIEDGNLIVRGKFLMFGRSYTWYPVEDSDFSESFKKPDVTKFVPSFPNV